MRPLLAFLHVFGSALWIGGALAAMVVSIAARREQAGVRAGVFRMLARVHTWVIAPGALVSVATGLALVMVFMSRGLGDRLGVPSISAMMGAGLLGGLLVLFFGLPAAHKLGAAAVPDEQGNLPPVVDRLRRRLAVVSSIAGVLALVALWFGVVGA